MSQASQNLPAVQPWEHDVQNDQIEMHLLREVQSFESIFGDINDKTCFPESLLQELGCLCFIFNDKDLHDWPTGNECVERKCICRSEMIYRGVDPKGARIDVGSKS